MELQDIYEMVNFLQYLKVISMNFDQLLTTKEQRNQLIIVGISFMRKLDELLQKYNLSLETRNDIQRFEKRMQPLVNKLPEKEFFIEFKTFITNRIDIWQDRIRLEIGKLYVIKPYTSGELNYDKLIKGIQNHFESSTWKNLTELNKMDLEDFRICYLSKAWTPAGIMLMRVIESAVRKYYTDLTGKKLTGWGKITVELKKHPKADKTLVDELDDLRKNVRNPLAHPEERMDVKEVEKTFLQVLIILPKIYT